MLAETIRTGGPGHLGSAAFLVLTRLDLDLVNLWLGTTAVGIYGLATALYLPAALAAVPRGVLAGAALASSAACTALGAIARREKGPAGVRGAASPPAWVRGGLVDGVHLDLRLFGVGR